MNSNFRIIFAGLALGWAGLITPSFANPVFELVTGNCQTPTQLRVAAMPASAVLDKLAQALGFTVSFRADADPLLNAELSAPATELLLQLTHQMNVITVTEPDPHCAGQARIVRLVTLPTGQATQRIESVPEGLQRYRQAHGMDPLTGAPVKPR